MSSMTHSPRLCPHGRELIYPQHVEEQPEPIYPACGCPGSTLQLVARGEDETLLDDGTFGVEDG